MALYQGGRHSPPQPSCSLESRLRECIELAVFERNEAEARHATLQNCAADLRDELIEARIAVAGYQRDCEELRQCVPELTESVQALRAQCSERHGATLHGRLADVRADCELQEENPFEHSLSSSYCSQELRLQLQQAEDRVQRDADLCRMSRRRIASLEKRRDELRSELVEVTSPSSAKSFALHRKATAPSLVSPRASHRFADVPLAGAKCCHYFQDASAEAAIEERLRLEMERSELNEQISELKELQQRARELSEAFLIDSEECAAGGGLAVSKLTPVVCDVAHTAPRTTAALQMQLALILASVGQIQEAAPAALDGLDPAWRRADA
eukprot:TRINITY_DN30471_c0_g1_i1.p1 TRINITY_DN30471_c0_g1~~TRINITY_DN30471_c0_g1_i1.p1  ORF type:complete len:328 (+),score=68.56 TRINITY_DN30471_c0_g1_i1:35-1018(+)